MEFSQYVIEVIRSINIPEKDRGFHARSLIKGAAEKANNETDTHTLNVVAECISMSYNIKEQKFAPFIVEYGIGRSFAPEDLNESDIEILRLVIQTTESLWLRTRCAHIIWSLKKEYNFGQLAAAGYLDIYIKSFDSEHWSSCFNKIKIAYHISSTMGKNSPIFKRARSQIIQDLEKMNGTDPLFLSLQMLQLICKDLRKDELPKLADIAEKIFNKNTNQENNNTRLADESFSVLKLFYDRLKKNDELKEAKKKYAMFYEIYARQFVPKNDNVRAVFFMQTACLIYADVDRAKAQELRLEMEAWQQMIPKQLHSFKTTINVEETANTINQMFRDLTLTEAIVQFGRMAKIYKIEEVRQAVLEEHFLTSMWGTALLNDQGQIVQRIPAFTQNESDSEILHKHMIHHVSMRRQLVDSIPVKIAFERLRQFKNVPEDALAFLVQDNALIPNNRVDIIKEGLCLALNGKLYTAMHLLLPQTENIFRHLVKLCDDTVTFLSKDKIEEYKPLSSLLNSEKLHECYDENVIFSFQSILEDAAGENLRNLTAHGLLEPSAGNGKGPLCFLSMLIRLLTMYSKEANSVLEKLLTAQDADAQT